MHGSLQVLTKQDRKTPNPLTFLLDLLTSSMLISHCIACACSVMSNSLQPLGL